MNGDAADGSKRLKLSSGPLKMLRPRIAPRMKEPHDLPGLGIYARYIGPFVSIAADAG